MVSPSCYGLREQSAAGEFGAAPVEAVVGVDEESQLADVAGSADGGDDGEGGGAVVVRYRMLVNGGRPWA